jgi:hypothetical protein
LAPNRTWSKENSQKGIDDMPTVLHNLVSLLLMQRRRTKRYRVVARVSKVDIIVRCGFGGECGPIFKN